MHRLKPPFSEFFSCTKQSTAWLFWGGQELRLRVQKRCYSGEQCILFLPEGNSCDCYDWLILKGMNLVVVATFAVHEVGLRKLLHCLIRASVAEVVILSSGGEMLAFFESGKGDLQC